MGAISIILSDQLVSGFSCGAAVHVVVSQIPSVLEIKAHKIKNIPFAVFYVSAVRTTHRELHSGFPRQIEIGSL